MQVHHIFDLSCGHNGLGQAQKRLDYEMVGKYVLITLKRNMSDREGNLRKIRKSVISPKNIELVMNEEKVTHATHTFWKNMCALASEGLIQI